MKKILFAVVLFAVALAAHASPYDMRFIQLDSIGNGMFPRVVPFPASGVCLNAQEAVNKTNGIGPTCLKLSSYITINPTSLELEAYPLSANPAGYVDQTGARAAVSLTTTGSSGAATYDAITGIFNIPNYAPGSGTVTSITAGTGLNGGTITTSGTVSMPNTGTAGAYSGVTTDAQGRVTTGTARSFAYVTKSLNTCYQLSVTRDLQVSYGVEISVTSTLASGQVGTVYLETFTNSGCSTGVQEVGRITNGYVQALGLSVTVTSNVAGALHGIIPAGLWVKLRTENNTGTPTFTARPGQEISL